MQTRVMPKGLSVRTQAFVTAQTAHAGFGTVTIVTGRIAAFVYECGSPVFLCRSPRVVFFASYSCSHLIESVNRNITREIKVYLNI